MRLVESNMISTTRRSRSKNYDLLMEFLNSDMKCAKVEGWTYKNPALGTRSLNNSIRYYSLAEIYADTDGKEIYLIKKV